MVMGFALCASVAFAQTNRISIKDNAVKNEKAPTATKAPVDYKASIFGKANGHDTIQVFKIDVPNDYTIGVIQASDRINDTLVGNANAHNQAGDLNHWQRIPSCQAFLASPATYVPGLVGWLGASRMTWITEDIDPALSPNEPADDGFMFMSYWESSQASGIMNTYFTIPTVQRPAGAQMIEVSLTQCYRKYYDQCFIDYKVGNQWYAREINVTGIDMGVNDWAANKVRYVLPHALNSEQNIQLRIRAYSYHRGNVFGYFWAVDNVAVMALTLNEYWALNSPTNIDGFYGVMPQGMTVPMTYGVNAQNLSTSDIANAHATLSAGTSRNSLSTVLTGPNVTVPQGDLDNIVPVIINERGFFVEGEDAASGYQSWPSDGTNTSYGQDHLNPGQLGRGLPVTTAGKNYYSINVASGNLSRTYDTILYYVSPMQEFTSPNRESGYRWAHDNGVIAGGSSFQVAFTDRDAQGNAYVTPDGSDPENGAHAHEAGYATHVRFITGNDIPTDDNGDPWVFRGIELIAACDRQVGDMEGAPISPVAYKDSISDDGSLYFTTLPCGIDGLAFEVSENDINDQLYSEGGYILPSAGYKAINIQFAEQPAMEPNTSYRFGYRLADNASFVLAGSQNYFKFINDTNGIVNVPFRYGTGVNDTLAQYAQAAQGVNDYRYQFAPASYLEVIVYDPIIQDNITAWNIDNYPLIRPIVGPARPAEYANVIADCSNNTDSNGVQVTRGNESLCGNMIQAVVGGNHRIDFDPIGDHTVIDRVLLNGVELTPYDEATGEGDYRQYDASVIADDGTTVLLERSWWLYYLSDIEADEEYEFTVYSHWEEFNNIGIDPVAPEVTLGIAPNPATSVVKLNVQGVSGKVNCSILDMSGRVIYNADINAESEHTVDVSNIPAGAYFVRVTNDTFSKIQKLIIK